MTAIKILCALTLGVFTTFASGSVLIVADEFPAMEVLAESLKAEEGIDSQIVSGQNLPSDLAHFRSVMVYVHGELAEATERALIDYAKAGGRLVALHHSISSGKRKNAFWFEFLGVELKRGSVEEGGYKWAEPVTLQWVNLAPGHFITSHKIVWPETTLYRGEGEDGGRVLPAFTLHESEVYLNHTLHGARTLLLGCKYRDEKTGELTMQDRAGWYKPAGRGWVFYFQPGHSEKDFGDPSFVRLVINAVICEM